MSMTLAALADCLGAELRGEGGYEVEACAGLEEATPRDVSFVANRKYARFMESTRAGAVIVGKDSAPTNRQQNLLVAGDPYFAFREAVVALHGFRRHPKPGISPQAIIHPSARLGKDCCVHPFVYIAENARLGDRCVIYPHGYIGEGAVLGDDCLLYPSVTIYHDCVLGHRVTLHAGCVIGQDGFGYALHDGAHQKIPQVGNVVIEDDVEMGANCAIDRATVGSTRIGKGTKFSDLVAIGHGAHVGEHNLLVAQVGLAGSAETGAYVAMGGQVGVAGHLKIGAMAQLAAKSGVMTDIPDGAQYGGSPAMPLSQAKRQVLALTRLPDLFQQFKQLQKKVASLEAALEEQKQQH